MKRKLIIDKLRARKSGYGGDRMWRAHRLEGDVKNRAIKPIKKKKTYAV